MRPLRCFAGASITTQGNVFPAFSTFSSNPRTSTLEEASRSSKMLALRASSKPQELEKLAKRPQKRLHEAPKRCQMALRSPPKRRRGVQEPPGGLLEPLSEPQISKNGPRTSVFRASSKPHARKHRARPSRKPLRAIVEATVAEASKLCDTSAKRMLEEAVEDPAAGLDAAPLEATSLGVGRRRTRGQVVYSI